MFVIPVGAWQPSWSLVICLGRACLSVATHPRSFLLPPKKVRTLLKNAGSPKSKASSSCHLFLAPPPAFPLSLTPVYTHVYTHIRTHRERESLGSNARPHLLSLLPLPLLLPYPLVLPRGRLLHHHLPHHPPPRRIPTQSPCTHKTHPSRVPRKAHQCIGKAKRGVLARDVLVRVVQGGKACGYLPRKCQGTYHKYIYVCVCVYVHICVYM